MVKLKRLDEYLQKYVKPRNRNEIRKWIENKKPEEIREIILREAFRYQEEVYGNSRRNTE